MKYASIVKSITLCFGITILTSFSCQGAMRHAGGIARMLTRRSITTGRPVVGAVRVYAPLEKSFAATFIDLRTTIINKRLATLRELCARGGEQPVAPLLKFLCMLESSATSREPEDVQYEHFLDAIRYTKPTGLSDDAFYADLQAALLRLEVKYHPAYGGQILSLQEQAALDAIANLVKPITAYLRQLHAITEILMKH